MRVGLTIQCDCGACMTITPPKEIQQMQKHLRYFDINCGYCERRIGTFHFVLNSREE